MANNNEFTLESWVDPDSRRIIIIGVIIIILVI